MYPEVIDSVLLMLLKKLIKQGKKPLLQDEFFLMNPSSMVIVKVIEELS
jgi:hypothetical protein